MDSELILYTTEDGVTKVDVTFVDETVWLTQAQIATVFNVGRPAITKHIRNIYACGELEENSTCSILEHMGNAGQHNAELSNKKSSVWKEEFCLMKKSVKEK